jgi:4-diphosphocytidyl-2-C-methyl-D-erythritol kinase
MFDFARETAFEEQARAKVNLTLHVLGRRPDGYHELESLVVFADFSDRLAFRAAPSDSLVLDGQFGLGVDGENLVLKAKKAAAAWLGREFYGSFELTKNIPVAAGLGGGSSDAAAALRILFRAYGDGAALQQFSGKAASIGADVPVCLHHRAAWMAGLGERVTPADVAGRLPAVLVNPGVKLSTAAVFKHLAAPPYIQGPSSHAPFTAGDFASPDAAAAWLKKGRNDLEAPAIALEPTVKTVLEALREQNGCLLARLSGSGPTCFGLFPTARAAQEASEQIAAAHPSWWVTATALS